MKKVIKLNENDFGKLVKKIIYEVEQQKLSQQKLQSQLTDCFDRKKYPNVYLLMEGTGQSLISVFLVGLSVLESLGIITAPLTMFTIPAFAVTSYASAQCFSEIKSSKALQKEIKQMYDCIF